MNDKDLIKYVLRTKDMKQKDLAALLEVSQIAISRWTTGKEPLPTERREAVLKLAGLDCFDDIKSVEFFGSKEKEETWIQLLVNIAEEVDQESLTPAYEGETWQYMTNMVHRLVERNTLFPSEIIDYKEFHDLLCEEKLPPFYDALYNYIQEYTVRRSWVYRVLYRIQFDHAEMSCESFQAIVDIETALIDMAFYALSDRHKIALTIATNDDLVKYRAESMQLNHKLIDHVSIFSHEVRRLSITMDCNPAEIITMSSEDFKGDSLDDFVAENRIGTASVYSSGELALMGMIQAMRFEIQSLKEKVEKLDN